MTNFLSSYKYFLSFKNNETVLIFQYNLFSNSPFRTICNRNMGKCHHCIFIKEKYDIKLLIRYESNFAS